MVRNKKGFEYPLIDSTKCVSCGACENVCDFQNPKGSKNHILQAYAMQHRDKEVVFNSSSGGAFTAISDWVLLQGGTIYGAAFDKETFYKYLTVQKRILDENPLQELDAPKIKKTLPKYLTLEESLDLLKSGNSQCKNIKSVVFPLLQTCVDIYP